MNALPQSMPAGPGVRDLANPRADAPVHFSTSLHLIGPHSIGRSERPSGRKTADRTYRDYRLTLVVAMSAALGGSFAACQAWLDTSDALFVQGIETNSPAPVRTASPESLQDQQATFLVRSTLMALNDANRSGNYSVLRDLAGPRFQERNSVLRLREVFQAFREAGVDLSPAGMVPSSLTRMETRASDSILILEGGLPMGEEHARQRLRFAMEFEPIAGHWRLLTLAVGIDANR
jgi:hypothetical protein